MTDYATHIERDEEGRPARIALQQIPAPAPQTPADTLRGGGGGPDATSSVLKRTRACLACRREFPVNPCHAKEHLYCSPRCRAQHYRQERQRALPLEPPPVPVVPVRDPAVPLDEEEKLRGDNALVLRRLRVGPATTAELQAAAPRSMAIHSRVSDVRGHLRPLGETVRRERVGPRLNRYWIEGL